MEHGSLTPLPLTEATKSVNLDDLIKPFDNLSLESDDNDEIQDVFEEFHRDSFLRPYADPNKKYLSMSEANRRTVEGFTEEFKRTMKAIRNEIGDLLCDEESGIEELLERRQKPPLPNAKFDENRGTPIEIERQRDAESTSSSESNFWRRLATNSGAKFQVSPPNFDAFGQEEKHWLERPSIAWETVEASRTKCKKWLEESP